jgi:uncharacterized protein affecting Mg2+/Co2+ transport
MFVCSLSFANRYSLLAEQQQQEALLQLAAQEQAWQQQQQQQHVSARNGTASESHAGVGKVRNLAPAGPDGGQATAAAVGSKPFRQSVVLGPCAASAGPAAVPPALATLMSWSDAAAAAATAGSNGGSGAAAACGSNGGCSSATHGVTSPGLGAGVSATNTAAAAAAEGDIPSSCQLESRHWVIFNPQGSEVDRVAGEGVVGLYPLLYPGATTPFAYASCTPCAVPDLGREAALLQVVPAASAAEMEGNTAVSGGDGDAQQQQQQQQVGVTGDVSSSSSGANRWQTGPGRLAGCVVGCMEGSFNFVEGSLMQRAGESFKVVCPRIVFAVPEYLF